MQSQVSALREIAASQPVRAELYDAERARRTARRAARRAPHGSSYSLSMDPRDRAWYALGLYGRLTFPAQSEALQIAGYYSHDQKILRVSLPDSYRDPTATLRTALRDDPEFRAVLAHELTHALVDQRVDLSSYFSRGAQEKNADAMLARRAVAEGDAELLEYRFRGGKLSALADDRAARELPYAQDADLAPSQRIVSLFPYQEGALFAAAIYQARGNPGLDALYHDPPRTTAEVLHPELYEQPGHLTARTPDLHAAREHWPEANVLWEDTVGELFTRALLVRLLPEREAITAAAGWRGDRFAVYRDAGPLRVVWLSNWSSEEEAAEFRHALSRWLQARYPDAAWSSTPLQTRAQHQERWLVIEQHQDTVAMLTHAPNDPQALLDALLRPAQP